MDTAPLPSDDEVRAALARITAAADFARAPRLQQLLRFVCDQALAGKADGINEYLIGVEVFGRGPSYDPADDAVVRRHAHLLRQKLRLYYADEGRADPVRIEIPVGGYVPTFSLADSAPGPAPAPPVSLPPAPRRRGAALVLVAAGALAVGFILRGAVAPPVAPGPETETPLRRLWARWLRAPTQVTIALSNPLTAVVRHVSDPRARQAHGGLPLVVGSAEDASFRRFFGLPAHGFVYLWPDAVQGKIGEAHAAVRVGAMLARHRVTVVPSQSAMLTWDLLRRQDVVLLGNAETNRWLTPLLERQPLRILPPQRDRPRRIVDTTPAAGGPAEYTNAYPDGGEDLTVQFALVAMLPGLDPSHQLLVVAGLNSQATDMAAEFLVEPRSAADLVQRLEAASGTRGPWHFQAVVRAEVRDRVPTRGAVVALRPL